MDNLKKILRISLFSLISLLIFRILFPISSQIDQKLINERIEIVFLKKFSSTELQELKQKIFSDNYDYKDLEKYLKVFRIGIDSKQKNIVEIINPDFNLEVKQKIKDSLDKIFKKNKFYFYYKDNLLPNSESENISEVRKFFTIKVGSNLDYLKQKYFKEESSLKIGFLDNFQFLDINNIKDIQVYENINNINSITKVRYNFLIRDKKNINKDINNSLFLKSDSNGISIEVLVDDTGDLPIQWPYKLKWNFLLFWGYIWNVLLIFISSLLYYSTYILYSEEGIFFGNLGLGIILTTILIRTLLWPIYTKTNSFSLNMSRAQPEINKIQQKYYLKKDPDSIKKMQLEIFKVYKKHNFSFFDIFISFLQMPIFIAMLRTLNRIRVNGGIFSISVNKPFLNFIYFNSYYSPNYYFLVKIFLSFLVGISMFFLNKINFQKKNNKNNNDRILTLEQINKNKAQEKNIQIVSYIMIFFMMITSFQDACLSLYWIIGNIYTIFQTIINRKIMEKKYSNKNFDILQY
ncbi:MAG: preprotein translocase subunit [Candidatus Phytoplasma cynodontis]|uniref:YidC/Oxa1 family membrane protein insertase n=1 Tax='Cynodon dactylon' phytoplasma TaxID=295320 RepID=UPI001265D69B|nr:YidC/Oxa1 family membrane protein insertase ['Cynodon dactylon' phytoplasma]KAB8121902.1 YidC/Oxa1 family membrane protein insertase ['Cynodon dactylon' phytoplasma]WIA07770.1 MAG: preprotein translocase subunit [Candidatus Phytoplasma cynodontis]